MQVDIVINGETNTRSTALHAALLAPSHVRVFGHSTRGRCDPLELQVSAKFARISALPSLRACCCLRFSRLSSCAAFSAAAAARVGCSHHGCALSRGARHPSSGQRQLPSLPDPRGARVQLEESTEHAAAPPPGGFAPGAAAAGGVPRLGCDCLSWLLSAPEQLRLGGSLLTSVQ